jgi:CheY-like chemotaxis protein
MTTHEPHATHVLVIEDDATTRELVQLALEDAGYTVTVARDGVAALEVLWAVGVLPDLILLDLGMPLIDGRTFRRMQQGNPQWRTIPVVVMSGNSEVHATAHAVGIEAVLLKPFTVSELLATVERAAR